MQTSRLPPWLVFSTILLACGSEPPPQVVPSEVVATAAGGSGPVIASSDGHPTTADSVTNCTGSPEWPPTATSGSNAEASGSGAGCGGASAGLDTSSTAVSSAGPEPAGGGPNAATLGGAAGQVGTSMAEVPVEVVIAVGNLLITEYIESGKDKAVELTNMTDVPVPLASCQLSIYFNGNLQAGNKILLDGTLAPAATHVLCSNQPAADLLARCDQPTGSVSFNGDDAIVLSCGGEVHDGLGQIGFQPADGRWGSADYGTADQVLRRRCESPAYVDLMNDFDVTQDWVVVAPATGAERDLSGLGAPDCAEALDSDG